MCGANEKAVVLHVVSVCVGEVFVSLDVNQVMALECNSEDALITAVCGSAER